MQRTSKILIAAALVLTVIAALGYLAFRETISPIPITISRISTPHSGLLHIAEANGYFAEEGLEATLRTTSTGYEALEEMLQGQADVGAAAETPIARAIAEGKDIRVITTIFTSTANVGVVARKDRGIAQPEDLHGKRIGFVFGTATHYMLETFLAYHKIPVEEVTLVPIEPDRIIEALLSGELDAAASWNPNLARMRQQLGEDGVFFSPADFYAETYNLVVQPDYLAENREAVDRLLRALSRAETFAATNPDAAERIIAEASGSVAALTGVREPLTHELSLKQSLLLATENQVDWYFRRGLIPPGPSPDVLNAFEPDPLRTIKPSAVTIVK